MRLAEYGAFSTGCASCLLRLRVAPHVVTTSTLAPLQDPSIRIRRGVLKLLAFLPLGDRKYCQQVSESPSK